MGNAIESAATGLAPGARQGFKDGLGERIIVPGTGPGELVEVLQLRDDLTAVSSFEFALRERAARLANFQHESYAHVRHIDRSAHGEGRLALISDHVEGWRLADILGLAADRRLELDINAALSLIGQLVHGVAILHRHARGVAHGAIAPERLVVTAHARLVIVEYVLGSALERLELTRERLWRELRVAAPPAAGGLRFDHRADVTQVGAVAMALVLGRPLTDDDFPHHVADLLASATENRALGGRQPLSRPLRAWLARALQLDFRNSFPSAIEAEASLEALFAEEPAYVAAPVALETFLSLYERALRTSKPAGATTPPTDVTSPADRASSGDVRNLGPESEDRTALVGQPAVVEALETTDVRQPGSIDAEPEPDVAVARQLRRGATAGFGILGLNGDVEADGTGNGGVERDDRSAPSAAPAPDFDEIGGTAVRLPGTTYPGGQVAPNARVAPTQVDRVSSPDVKADAPPAGETGHPQPDLGQGYPGAFETMFGTRPEGKSAPTVAREADVEKDSRAPTVPGEGHRRLFRVALVAAAIVLLVGGGYIGFRLLFAGAGQPATGTLTVESNPAGLAVKIDGSSRGVTPLKASLAPGSHILTVETPIQARVIPIKITAGSQMSQYIETQAAPVTGRLQITSEPPGASVTIDGEARGTAPVTVSDLPPGLHTVELQSDGGKVQQNVTIEAGATSSLVVPVARQSGPVSGWIGVTAPVEIQVFEGGQLLGTSGNARILMTAGRHELELVNETLGYRNAQVVVVPPGKLFPIRVALPKGTLNVNAVPWAEVWIDGDRIGETPIGNLALPIGPHEVVFRHPQYPEQRHAVTVTTKAPVRVSVDLRK